LSYECRNGIKIGAGRNQNFVLDISSTSSEDEDVRLLKELKGNFSLKLLDKKLDLASLKAAKDKKKMKKAKKKAKKAAREKRREDRKPRERSHSRSRSRSRSRDRRYRR